MKSFKYLLITLFLALSFMSCGIGEEANESADQFFELIVSKDFSAAARMIQTSPMDTTNYLYAIEKLAVHPELGNLVSADKNWGFNMKTENGVTSSELKYTLKYENGEHIADVKLVDRGNGYKIVYIQ